jgi:hypothetical protein
MIDNFEMDIIIMLTSPIRSVTVKRKFIIPFAPIGNFTMANNSSDYLGGIYEDDVYWNIETKRFEVVCTEHHENQDEFEEIVDFYLSIDYQESHYSNFKEIRPPWVHNPKSILAEIKRISGLQIENKINKEEALDSIRAVIEHGIAYKDNSLIKR